MQGCGPEQGHTKPQCLAWECSPSSPLTVRPADSIVLGIVRSERGALLTMGGCSGGRHNGLRCGAGSGPKPVISSKLTMRPAASLSFKTKHT